MTDEELFRETFSHLHASGDTLTEVMKMKKKNHRTHRMSGLLLAAAIVFLIAVLGAGAYAANLFGFRDAVLGDTNAEHTFADGEYVGYSAQPGTIVSMQGYGDSTGFKAYQEFKNFYDAYVINNYDGEEMPQEQDAWQTTHRFYGVYTQTLKTRLLEICEKYGLKTRDAVYEGGGLATLRGITGQSIILDGYGLPADVGLAYQYLVYDDGSFLLQSDWHPDGNADNYDQAVPYALTRNMKGSFSTGYLYFEADETPVEQSYTTARGDTVNLVMGKSTWAILYDGEDAFVVTECGQLDIMQQVTGMTLSVSDLQKFADTIDFAALGRSSTVIWPDQTTETLYTETYSYNAQPADLPSVSMGTPVEGTDEVESGTLTCTVDDVQIGTNVRGLGVDPADLFPYDGVTFWNAKTPETWLYPDYLNLDTGELADHFRFVLVTVTIENTDAVSYAKSTAAVDTVESQYLWNITALRLLDAKITINENGENPSWTIVWFSAQGQRTEGFWWYEVQPGQRNTYQIGFIVGNAEDNFDGLYLEPLGPESKLVKLN